MINNYDKKSKRTTANVGGRPAENDYKAIIDFLKEKYKGDNQAQSVEDIIKDNPRLAGKLKTLQNSKSKELFGMTLGKYLKVIGVIGVSQKTVPEKPAKEKKRKVQYYLAVYIEDTDELVFCAVDKQRRVSEGDFVKIHARDSEELISGSVIEYCENYEDELPVPIEEMYQYSRKQYKSEIEEAIIARTKYTLCRVRVERNTDEEYYISPSEDIEAGDIVEVRYLWYDGTCGVVTKVEHVTGRTAPVSVKELSHIDRIVRRRKDEIEKVNKNLNMLIEKNGTEVFKKSAVDARTIERFDKTAYFSGAVFRGLDCDADNALRHLYPKSIDLSKYKTNIGGIVQFECVSSQVPYIVENHPNLKGVFFAEDWRENMVYLAYSESGYPTITSIRQIGKCDFYNREKRWTLFHDPTEEKFGAEDINYTFTEKPLWENCDYVLPDGGRKLAAKASAESKPYAKTPINAPCNVIEICFPGMENTGDHDDTKLGVQNKEKGVFAEYIDAEGNAHIPVDIDNIPPKAFINCAELRCISIPENITQIGKNAFENCVNLEVVEMTNAVKVIEESAFMGCEKLENINLSANVDRISTRLFKGCKSLEKIVIPDNVNVIEQRAFFGCEKLKSVNIPSGVRSIETELFSGCGSLESVVIPNETESIEERAFEYCKSLKTINIPGKCTKVPAFNGCELLKAINADKSNDTYSSVDGVLYRKNGKKLCMEQYPLGKEDEVFSAPEELSEISAFSFMKCKSLKTVKLSAAVKIRKNGFWKCEDVTIVTSKGSPAAQYAKDNNMKLEEI